jgi:hypothetical protein
MRPQPVSLVCPRDLLSATRLPSASVGLLAVLQSGRRSQDLDPADGSSILDSLPDCTGAQASDAQLCSATLPASHVQSRNSGPQGQTHPATTDVRCVGHNGASRV